MVKGLVGIVHTLNPSTMRMEFVSQSTDSAVGTTINVPIHILSIFALRISFAEIGGHSNIAPNGLKLNTIKNMMLNL